MRGDMIRVLCNGDLCDGQIIELALDSGVRLDECVAQALKSSRHQAKELIKSHGVWLNGRHTQKSGVKLTQSSTITIRLPESKALESKLAESKAPESKLLHASALDSNPPDSNLPESSPLESKPPTLPFTAPPDIAPEILYEDSSLLILNKPPHLVVHGAPSVKEPTLVDWLQARGTLLSTLGGEQRAGIVHRLDKQTSGAIAIAKTNAAHANLSQQLKDRSMGRYYLALIDAPIKEPRVIACYLDRHPNNRLKMASVNSMRKAPAKCPTTLAKSLEEAKSPAKSAEDAKLPAGAKGARYSKSTFLPLLCTDSISLVAIKLHTGRTHQIRAHLESISRHILGDSLYGYKGAPFDRVMLHAYLLYLNHPATHEPKLFCAGVFADMLQCAHKIFGVKEFDEAIEQDALVQAFAGLDDVHCPSDSHKL